MVGVLFTENNSMMLKCGQIFLLLSFLFSVGNIFYFERGEIFFFAHMTFGALGVAMLSFSFRK